MVSINQIKWHKNKDSFSNNHIIKLHKDCLPKDPLMNLSKNKKFKFYDLAKKYCHIYLGSYNKSLIAFGCFLKLSFIPNSKKEKVIFSILLYIFVDKKYQRKSLGKYIINNFLEYSNFILLVTKEKTYLQFYKKFRNSSFAFLGRRLVCIRK